MTPKKRIKESWLPPATTQPAPNIKRVKVAVLWDWTRPGQHAKLLPDTVVNWFELPWLLTEFPLLIADGKFRLPPVTHRTTTGLCDNTYGVLEA
jgi:hypothetical protein